jgi:hypothetical protein
MRRRDFIRGIVGLAAAWPLAVRAQQAAVQRIAVVMPEFFETSGASVTFFETRLKELGWTPGRSARVDLF